MSSVKETQEERVGEPSMLWPEGLEQPGEENPSDEREAALAGPASGASDAWRQGAGARFEKMPLKQRLRLFGNFLN